MTHADSDTPSLGTSRDTATGAAPVLASTRPPIALPHDMDLEVHGVSAVSGDRYELPVTAAGPGAGCPIGGCDCGGR